MSRVSFADVLELSVPERIRLVEGIRDSIATVPMAMPLSEAQREELTGGWRTITSIPKMARPGKW